MYIFVRWCLWYWYSLGHHFGAAVERSFNRFGLFWFELLSHLTIVCVLTNNVYHRTSTSKGLLFNLRRLIGALFGSEGITCAGNMLYFRICLEDTVQIQRA